MDKNYVNATENMPHILKFKNYYKKGACNVIFFNSNLHSITHYLAHLKNSRKNILTSTHMPFDKELKLHIPT